eukprot:392151-Prymnesium_polylepis.1
MRYDFNSTLAVLFRPRIFASYTGTGEIITWKKAPQTSRGMVATQKNFAEIMKIEDTSRSGIDELKAIILEKDVELARLLPS